MVAGLNCIILKVLEYAYIEELTKPYELQLEYTEVKCLTIGIP